MKNALTMLPEVFYSRILLTLNNLSNITGLKRFWFPGFLTLKVDRGLA